MTPFDKANAHLKEQLGYHLDPQNADRFRAALKRAGLRRFYHAVMLMKQQNSRDHARLLRLMWQITPAKKYRDPRTQHGLDMQREMDKQALLAMALDD